MGMRMDNIGAHTYSINETDLPASGMVSSMDGIFPTIIGFCSHIIMHLDSYREKGGDLHGIPSSLLQSNNQLSSLLLIVQKHY